jgi:hypothetical protein
MEINTSCGSIHLGNNGNHQGDPQSCKGLVGEWKEMVIIMDPNNSIMTLRRKYALEENNKWFIYIFHIVHNKFNIVL